jgi:hypothetical protein
MGCPVFPIDPESYIAGGFEEANFFPENRFIGGFPLH